MKVIYKYKLLPDKRNDIELPKDSTILSSQIKNGSIVIWALVDPDLPVEKRTFLLLETGQKIPSMQGLSLSFISTIQLHLGTYVIHLFEIT